MITDTAFHTENENFKIEYKLNKNLSENHLKREFKLHSHDSIELFLFLSGNASFVIDGALYNLSPYDILVIPQYKLHHAIPNSGDIFERLIINIDISFFEYNRCPEYQGFLDEITNYKNKIPAYFIKQTNIPYISDSLKDLILKKHKINPNPVINSKLVELIYFLNNNTHFESFNSRNKLVQTIISYIDENYCSDISLDSLAQTLSYSKNHMCRIFKKSTGMTINSYINMKRFNNVKELCKKGENLTSACFDSGFNSYATFYSAYIKSNGCSPKKLLE